MTTIGMSGRVLILLPAQPVCARQSPERRKMVVCVYVCVCVWYSYTNSFMLLVCFQFVLDTGNWQQNGFTL